MKIGQPRLGPLCLPALRSLSMRMQTIESTLSPAFVAGSLEQLEQIELALGYAPGFESWVPDYAPRLRELLDAPTLTHMRRLILRVERGELQQEFAAMLLEAPLLNRLQQLDVSACTWSPAARSWIEQRRRTLPCQVRMG